MKKIYNAPSMKVFHIENESIIAMSTQTETGGSQSFGSAEKGTGSEDMSAGYRNNLWD